MNQDGQTFMRHIVAIVTFAAVLLLPSRAFAITCSIDHTSPSLEYPYIGFFVSDFGSSGLNVRFGSTGVTSSDSYDELFLVSNLYTIRNTYSDGEIHDLGKFGAGELTFHGYCEVVSTNQIFFYLVFDDVKALCNEYARFGVAYGNTLAATCSLRNGMSDLGSMFSWTLEPTLDISADEKNIGRSIGILKSSNTAVTACRVNGDTVKFNGGISDQFTIPNSKTSFNVEIIGCSASLRYNGEGTGSGKGSFPYFYQKVGSMTRKPFLSITKTSVTAKDSVTSTGENARSNIIKWYVASDPANDILPSDVFIVLRSSDASFSDPATVATVSLTSPSGSDSNGYYYKVDDKAEEAQYSKNSQKIYYRIVRSVVYANWSSHRGSFCKTDSIEPKNYCPMVSSIKVTKKDANFETNKAVKIRVETSTDVVTFRNFSDDNPYITASGKSLILTSSASAEIAFKKHYINKKEGSFYLTYQERYIGVKGGKVLVGEGDTLKLKFDTNCLVALNYNTNTNIAISDDLELNVTDGDAMMWTQNEQSIYCLPDAYSSISITRYSPKEEWYEGRDYAAKTITVSAEDVRFDKTRKMYYVEVEDVQSAPYTHYYYSATLDNTYSNYKKLFNDTVYTTEAEANACYSESIAQISSISATRGTARGRVVVQWNVGKGENTGYKVWRREYEQRGEAEKSWQEISSDDDQKATSYTDMNTYPGTAYEYQVQGYLDCRGKRYYTNIVTAAGYCCYYGSASGKLLMSDGSAVPFKTKANIKLRGVKDSDGNFRDLVIPTIYARNSTDSIIMPGIKTLAKEAMIRCDSTANDGYFVCDSIPFIANDKELTVYDVQMDMNDVINPTGSTGAYQLTFDNNTYEHTNLKFVSNKVHVFQGRVLFANSTIPSRGIRFYVSKDPDGKDKELLLDGNGNPVESDNNGDYKFAVPDDATMFIQAYKKGHTLYKDGKFDYTKLILKGDKNGTVFNITDSTTVRLVGRLVGGDTQGDKPLGFGLSKNNLGDDLRVVMMLEGDNSSYITYNEDDPDNTTRTVGFAQRVTDGLNNKDYVDPTTVTFERKRIVITPDVTTGEFVLDLAPTKYKITELSAKGYSTLFTEGEGYSVLDLTNDSVAVKHFDGVEAAVTTSSTEYHHAYNRVYHAPVKVTYQQYVNGMAKDYFGEGELSATNIMGGKMKVQSYQNGKYIFGYPVFAQENTYEMHVRAHEDYYYNNDVNTLPDEVPLKNDTLEVDNGFMSTGSSKSFVMDSLGTARFYVYANNVSYNLTGTADLRVLNMQVKQNGYYYNAEPLKAYITGTRTVVGDDVTTRTINNDITLLDIIRDPYTSTGYAYRERGTKYTWSNTQNYEISLTTGITLDNGTQSTVYTGAWVGVGGGGYTGTALGGSSTATVDLSLPAIIDYTSNHVANYAMTLNERIKTSDNSRDVGADADVYVGVVTCRKMKKEQAINILNDTTYNQLSAAFQSGRMKVVCQGTDSLGKKYYLATGEQYTIYDSIPTRFIYTQKHILNNVLPTLEKEMTSLLVYDTKANVQALADMNKKVYYRITKDTINLLWPNDTYHWYEMVKPRDGSITEAVDEVSVIAGTAQCWLNLIKINEEHKLKYKDNAVLLKNYSISGASIDYTESSSYSKKSWTTGSLLGIDSKTGNYNTKIGATVNTSSLTWNGGATTTTKTSTNDVVAENENGKGKAMEITTTVDIPGYALKLHIKPSFLVSGSSTCLSTKTYTAGSGFHMSNGSDEYIDVSVYEEAVVTNGANNVAGQEQAWTWSKDDWDWILSDKGKSDSIIGRSHDFIFVVTGGANHSPWYKADSTIVAQLQVVNGELKGTPLGTATLKMDVPKMYIANNTVSNLPKNERAVFSLTLANESEYRGKAKIATFKLYVDGASNPNGAQLYIDGTPISGGVQFYLTPGASIVKTLEVERGSQAYDYENIKLIFADQENTLTDQQTINVHYLPEATSVKITSPTDKWVMNTLSSQDENGKYYLPVNITGFDVNSENFDHIEVQYKKQTEGDASWVNLCSYYAKDDEYYQNATGTKKLLSSGSISDLRFYGEKDPMEMKYDLRAVSFNRLGNGYVTYASNVVSGTKDTRCPEVFGSPSPKSSILGIDDIISLKFSEDIAYNYLDETANFQVTGYTNSSEAQQQTYYLFNTQSTARTTLKESFKARSFTFEMKAYFPDYRNKAELISVVNADDATSSMCLNVEDNTLALYSNGEKIAQSGEISYLDDLSSKKIHVGVAYCASDTTVHFIVGDRYRDDVLNKDKKHKLIDVNGNIGFEPKTCAGTIYDLRLWDRYYDEDAYPYKDQTLTGTERYLLCYWPMDEGTGNVAKEKVYGMNMILSGGDWHLCDGYALHLNKRTVSLKNTEKIIRNSSQDFSLGFWVKRTALSDSEQNSPDTTQILRIGAYNDPIRFVYSSRDCDSINLVTKMLNKNILSANSKDGFSQWHHVMLTVDHINDVAAAYIDGMEVLNVTAKDIPAIVNSDFILGDENASIIIDGIEFWQMSLPSYYIEKGYNSRRDGTEMGLVIYVPFEQLVSEPEGYIARLNTCNQTQEDSSLMVMFDEPVEIVTNLTTSGQVMEATSDQCPRKAGKGMQVLPITWSSTGTELQINVNRSDADLNGQTINITVRGVEDLAGNPMENPKMWSAYVNRNALKWYDKSLNINADYGKATTFSAKWQNITGYELDYTLDNTATWLTMSKRSGTAEPMDVQSIDFELSDGLAPGSYSTVVYLTDEEGLSSPLRLNVTVTAQEPDWTVASSSDYNQTMNIIADVKQKDDNGRWIEVNDKRDVVGAFINNVCVGKANITVDSESGLSRLYMTIRGNSSCNKKKIKFYLWDASTDKRQQLVIHDEKTSTDKDTVFIKNTILGTAEPLEMRISSAMFQYIDLAQGWNWISFNVKHTTPGISSFFYNTEFTGGDIITIPGSSTFYSYDTKTKTWGASTVKLDQSNICQIYVQKAMTAKVTGEEFTDDTRYVVVNVKKAEGWTPLAYLLDVAQPLKQALTDFKIGTGEQDCAPGSVIKSFNAFAVATSDGKWMGSLTYLKPGDGYFLRSAKALDHDTIYYTNNTVSGAKTVNFNLETGTNQLVATSLSTSNHEHNSSMPVIATFADGSAKAGDVLMAYSNGEVVGSAEYDADAQLFFLSVNAEPKSSIKFAKVRGTTVEAVTKNTLDYQPNGVIGSLEKPYLVEFDVTTGIKNVDVDDNPESYDVMGRKYSEYKDIHKNTGVYILNGKKVTR